jgi:hypothetical protein
VTTTAGVKVVRATPVSGRLVIELDTIGEIKEWGSETIVSSGDQDLTVGQQSGCVTDTARVEIAGSAPGSCSWVIEFRTVGDAKLGKGTSESPAITTYPFASASRCDRTVGC